MTFVSVWRDGKLDLGAPVADGKEVLGVRRVTLDGVDRSVVRLERHADFLSGRLRLATAQVHASHLRPYHELGWLHAHERTDTH